MGTDFNYDDTSHQAIFDHINGGSGPNPLQDASRAWQRLGSEIGASGKFYVQDVISNILTNRTGAAAEAAALTTSALLPWIDDVTQTTAASAQRAQNQAEYWVTAKNNVPPVPPAPKSASFFGDPGEWAAEKMDWFPGVTSEQEQAHQRQQDAAEQARQAMRVYQANSNPNIDGAPAFTAPQALDGSIGSLPLTAPSGYGAGIESPVANTGAPAHFMAVHQPAGAHRPVATASPVHQPAQAPAATVSQLAEGRHAAPSAGRVAQPPAGWAGAGETAFNQGMPPGMLAASAGFGGNVTGRGSVSARGGSAGTRGTGAGGAHHAGFGPRPSTEFGPRPTAGIHPAPDEVSSARSSGAAPRGAAAGGYGQPFLGGAGQRGEQDGEHRSKYLLHVDSSSIVGDLPPTAPPVIGADY